jgi:hypothetical protein
MTRVPAAGLAFLASLLMPPSSCKHSLFCVISFSFHTKEELNITQEKYTKPLYVVRNL